jgi:hypothetical protein
MGMRVHASPQWWWRVLIVVVAVAGLYSADYPILAYTTQSSLIVIGYYCGVLYWMHRRVTVEAAAPRLRVAVLSWILLSGLVLHFVLARGRIPVDGLMAGEPRDISMFLLHYVLPVMVLLDWLLFRPYGQARWRDLLGWMLFPLSYAALVLARGSLLTGRYPYPFLNPNRQGWSGVGLWIVALTAGFALVGALLIAADRLRRPKMPTQGH